MTASPQLGGIVASASTLSPAAIEIRGDHNYVNRGKGKNGCGLVVADGTVCMKAQAHYDHLSLPLSLNVVGSRGGNFTYKTFKSAWEEVFLKQLSTCGLPIGWNKKQPTGPVQVQSILAEGEICFPKMPTVGRDQGNFRWFLEKCLGDALTKGGYLKDDSYWPEKHFEFGNLNMTHEPGASWTRVMLFPS